MYLNSASKANGVIVAFSVTNVPEACMTLNLSPSEAKLRGASGHSMKVEGEGQLLFMLPGTEKGVKHELQVTADGAMPEGLRILGIDFWHGLDSNVDMASQTVSGTTPDGEHFKLRFHVERGANEKQINFITAEQADSEESKVAGKYDMILTDTIQVHPGQALQVQMLLPDSVAMEVTASRWWWWTEPEKSILWEPTHYNIVVDDHADMFDAQHGAISITPTSASIRSMELAGADNIVKQRVYLITASAHASAADHHKVELPPCMISRAWPRSTPMSSR